MHISGRRESCADQAESSIRAPSSVARPCLKQLLPQPAAELLEQIVNFRKESIAFKSMRSNASRHKPALITRRSGIDEIGIVCAMQQMLHFRSARKSANGRGSRLLAIIGNRISVSNVPSVISETWTAHAAPKKATQRPQTKACSILLESSQCPNLGATDTSRGSETLEKNGCRASAGRMTSTQQAGSGSRQATHEPNTSRR